MRHGCDWRDLVEFQWRVDKLINLSWRWELIIELAKNGNTKNCKNWTGITLLCVVGNVLCGIVIDRIRSRVDCRLRKEQARYGKGRGTTEQVFILRDVIEQGNVWQTAHYLNFIDFKNAFDSIHLESMRAIMKKYGVPEKIIWMVKIFYQDVKCTIEDQG